MKFISRPMGLLEISGKSRLDLINRMSTNLVSLLKPGEGAATVLTTDVGRIIDRIIMYAGEETAIALTGEENGDNIARYLLRFVFFNDDFRVTSLGSRFSTLFVYGKDAASKIGEISGTTIDLPLHHWATITISSIELSVHATDPLDGGGYMLKIPVGDEETIVDALTSAGGTLMLESEFDALRIEAKQPRLRHELTGEFIPLETGLWEDVSFTKGCYTGQEIIARLDSRGKIAKQMVQFDTQGPIPVGTEVMANGKSAGIITTSAGKRALGYVKSSVLEKQIALTADEMPIMAVFEPPSG